MIEKQKPTVISYTEAEAAKLLHFKSERALADFRRRHFNIGDHYAKLGRNILYSPAHFQRILEMDRQVA